jgi:HEAT repeat protein
MSNQEQPKPGIEQRAENSTLGGGMMASQGDNNNQVQGDDNIQQGDNSQAQIIQDNSTGIQVKVLDGTSYAAKEINQYNNCTIVIGRDGGNLGNNRKEYNFQGYLSNIVQKYQHWSSDYTLTSTLDKRVEMGLKAQLIQPKKDCNAPGGEQKEKIETLPVIEAISKYAKEHVLLVGKPGSGKSTALQRLLWETADKIIKGENKRNVIPVLVELRSWQKQTTCVTELIQKTFQKNNLRLKLEEITDLLVDGRLLLLVDGLNELPSDDSRRNVADFREEYQQTPMIFTTRDLAVGGDLGIKKQLSMQPLTAEQMRQFVRAYLPKLGEKMLKQLGDKLQKFAETPLLLWMLCEVYKKSGKIPTNLGESFRNFTELYDNKLKADVPGYDNYRDWCRNLLEILAYRMMEHKKSIDFLLNIDKRLAEDILTEYIKKEGFDKPRDYAKRWLEDLLKHHVISMVDNNKIEFRHQLFQEYYAAEYLLRNLPENDGELKKDYLNLLKWTEPLALMLALVDDEEQAVRVVRLALGVDLILGARLAGEVKRDFQEKTVGLILEKKLHKKIEVDFLGITGSEFAVNHLINALKDKDTGVPFYAVDALGNIGNEAAVNALINTLNDGESWLGCTIRAADALGNIGNEAAVNALINALNNENLIDYLNITGRALGKIGNEAAVNALISALNHKNAIIRINAAIALGVIGNEVGVNTLINALSHKNSNIRKKSAIRTNAAIALGNTENQAAVNALINALNDEDLHVRHRAAIALEKGNETTVNALINALNNEDLHIRNRAAIVLDKIGNEAAVNALINTLSYEDSDIRISATEILGNTENEADINVLINALNDKNSYVRSISAVLVLGKIGDEAAVNALINALNDKDSHVRTSAANALGKIGNVTAVNALIDALNESYINLSTSAANALGKIGNEAAVNALINALNNKNSHVCKNAANALGKIGNKTAVNALINSLNHEGSDVRRSAANALGKILPDSKMSQMWCILLNGEIESKDIISNTQKRYKFYNYKIFHSPPN